MKKSPRNHRAKLANRRHNRHTRQVRRHLQFLLLLGFVPATFAQPFTVQGPGVQPADFRVTTFASGLSFPLGLAALSDGSLLVTVVQNASFFSGTNPGRILRLTDTNQNGLADSGGITVFSNLPTSLTALRVVDNLVFVTGPPHPIQVLRLGVTPAAPLTLAGRLLFTYPAGWDQHRHSELAVRRAPGFTNQYEVYFQVGARANFAVTTSTATLTNESIPGATGVLAGDAIHRITLIDAGNGLTASNLIQIAAGCRNAAGMAFHPATGDFYFQDNGIDGLVNGNEPHSADELNWIARTNLGGSVEFFGFPANYTAYRSNTFVGGAGIPPLIAFQPIPDPFTGRESEGANQIVFAPPGFPDGVNTGLFLGFHGRFSNAGLANEENPVVYANPAAANYFHFIASQQVGIGHLNGLLATRDSLFVADMVTTGNPSSGLNAGVIYQIKSLVAPSPPSVAIRKVGAHLELRWGRGNLEAADAIPGPWTLVADAFSPLLITPSAAQKYYRTIY